MARAPTIRAYKEIDEDVLKVAYKNAWSIESMEAHGAAGRDYIYRK